MSQLKPLKRVSQAETELLVCAVFRHRWKLHAGRMAKNVNGARVMDWQLTCESCGSFATEWRDVYGVRLPGTQRQYDLQLDYRSLLVSGFTHAQMFEELALRQVNVSHNSRV